MDLEETTMSVEVEEVQMEMTTGDDPIVTALSALLLVVVVEVIVAVHLQDEHEMKNVGEIVNEVIAPVEVIVIAAALPVVGMVGIECFCLTTVENLY
jgi:hypothetical protein